MLFGFSSLLAKRVRVPNTLSVVWAKTDAPFRSMQGQLYRGVKRCDRGENMKKEHKMQNNLSKGRGISERDGAKHARRERGGDAIPLKGGTGVVKNGGNKWRDDNHSSEVMRGTGIDSEESHRTEQFRYGWQIFRNVGQEVRSCPNNDLTLQRLDEWGKDLSKAEKLITEIHPPLENERKELIDLAKEIEFRRLLLSRSIYHERYYSEVREIIENDGAIKGFAISEETRFIRTEVKAIKPEYKQTEMYEKDLHGADIEYPDKEDSDAVFIYACYKNYYDPQEGNFYATENWRNRDQAKMDGEALPNSELLINQALDVVGGDPNCLNVCRITHRVVSNEEARKVVNNLVKFGETESFDPSSEAAENLLKTPNCRSTSFLLEQYRWLLGDKRLGEIKVTRYNDERYGYGDVSDITISLIDR